MIGDNICEYTKRCIGTKDIKYYVCICAIVLYKSTYFMYIKVRI